jgi:hypothetical protein
MENPAFHEPRLRIHNVFLIFVERLAFSANSLSLACTAELTVFSGYFSSAILSPASTSVSSAIPSSIVDTGKMYLLREFFSEYWKAVVLESSSILCKS